MFLLKSPILRGAPEFELATNTLVNAPKGYGSFFWIPHVCIYTCIMYLYFMF